MENYVILLNQEISQNIKYSSTYFIFYRIYYCEIKSHKYLYFFGFLSDVSKKMDEYVYDIYKK